MSQRNNPFYVRGRSYVRATLIRAHARVGVKWRARANAMATQYIRHQTPGGGSLNNNIAYTVVHER